VLDRNVEARPASFDDGKGEVTILGIRPDDGSVVLGFSGPFMAAHTDAGILVIELSRKPLINLFWMGTIIMFASGLLSMIQVRRKRRAQAEQETVAEDAVAVTS
jgi:hypothetical protein